MGTTGDELYKALTKSRIKMNFIIRQKNNLKPSDYKEPLIAIFNLQSSTEGNGTHWTAAIIPPPSKTINGIPTADKNLYFDSYGAAPAEEIVKFLKQNNRKIVYNDQQLQKLRTDTCGEFVTAWIRYMLTYIIGKSDKQLEQKYLQFIYNVLDTKDLDFNEKLVMDKVKIRNR